MVKGKILTGDERHEPGPDAPKRTLDSPEIGACSSAELTRDGWTVFATWYLNWGDARLQVGPERVEIWLSPDADDEMRHRGLNSTVLRQTIEPALVELIRRQAPLGQGGGSMVELLAHVRDHQAKRLARGWPIFPARVATRRATTGRCSTRTSRSRRRAWPIRSACFKMRSAQARRTPCPGGPYCQSSGRPARSWACMGAWSSHTRLLGGLRYHRLRTVFRTVIGTDYGIYTVLRRVMAQQQIPLKVTPTREYTVPMDH